MHPRLPRLRRPPCHLLPTPLTCCPQAPPALSPVSEGPASLTGSPPMSHLSLTELRPPLGSPKSPCQLTKTKIYFFRLTSLPCPPTIRLPLLPTTRQAFQHKSTLRTL